jgi:hypothetical protein
MYPLAAPTATAGDRHALDQAERVALHQHPVGERAGIALIGVAHDIFAVCPCAPATVFHLMPVGKPAPPRPRRPEARTASTTALGAMFSAARNPTRPPCAAYSSRRQRVDHAAALECQALLPRQIRHVLRPPNHNACGRPSSSPAANRPATSAGRTGP